MILIENHIKCPKISFLILLIINFFSYYIIYNGKRTTDFRRNYNKSRN